MIRIRRIANDTPLVKPNWHYPFIEARAAVSQRITAGFVGSGRRLRATPLVMAARKLPETGRVSGGMAQGPRHGLPKPREIGRASARSPTCVTGEALVMQIGQRLLLLRSLE